MQRRRVLFWSEYFGGELGRRLKGGRQPPIPTPERKNGRPSGDRPPDRSRPVASYRIATGLMIICTAPRTLAWPSTNMNSVTPSAASSSVTMFSRM